MDLKEAMQARHSVRQYKDQPLSVEVIAALQEEMVQAAEALEFERAAYLRDQIRELRKLEGTVGSKPKKS